MLRRKIFLAVVLAASLAWCSPLLSRPPTQDHSTLRDRAFLLFDQNNFLAALPLLEQLAKDDPNDSDVLVRLAMVLAGKAATLEDANARRELRLRARALLERANELGHRSELAETLLEQIPGNGEAPGFSANPEVEAAMREGEEAFAKSDFATALLAYRHAFEVDSNLYEAALFTGDIYFRMNQMDKAGEWFARAIKIDADRETAYRYWGDGLLRQGEMEDAGEKFIQAVICEPYQKATWMALARWAGQNKAALAHPKIESPNQTTRSDDGTVTIAIDAQSLDKSDGTSHRLVYEITRAAWRNGLFFKKTADEEIYRHSLREEVEALGLVAELVSKDLQAGKIKSLDASLAALLKLHEMGLLEPYVLLARADEGIARDYPAYRATHRDNLRHYIREFVISPEEPEEEQTLGAADQNPN